ncbi:chaperonin-like RBCX protein 1, chloroplastic isoform X3 [Dendrobium catenatum]|uniref:chaperonin-like RBCX protein 1, chloroplastic isoform X3 n=1 Tax=Dendrobium catenatum TaxID=906689 RepID=UPI0009F5D503|nr:chaperonin-like RBCX protein 1, chloroplastic isoform X3 [Dendrobium catenatum]
MECCLASLLRAPSLSIVLPGKSSRRSSSLHLRQLVGFHPSRCQKMFVPGFGEASPEAKAAANLHHFFTFVAIKIVLSQLQSYNREAYEELMEFVSRNSLNDGDQFCRRLMRESPRHKGLGWSYNLNQIDPAHYGGSICIF